MWNDEAPTRPEIPRVKIIQPQEKPTWVPPRRCVRTVAARTDEVSADLSRDQRIER
jgi:hypothetical protein